MISGKPAPRTAWCKRLLDVVVSATLLLLLLPVLVIVSLAICLSDRGPVLYRQRRVGRDNKRRIAAAGSRRGPRRPR